MKKYTGDLTVAMPHNEKIADKADSAKQGFFYI